ncbi:MAG: GNAT family N-acetyltransferase [Acidimicrobiia bacterium]
MAIEVRHQPDQHRYEIVVDDAVAGFAEYKERDGRHVFDHTVIDPSYEGQGLGGKLASGALDSEAAAGGKIVPLCAFIAGYIGKHPEYADLVDTEMLKRLSG